MHQLRVSKEFIQVYIIMAPVLLQLTLLAAQPIGGGETLAATGPSILNLHQRLIGKLCKYYLMQGLILILQ